MNTDETKDDVAGDFSKSDDQSSMNGRVAGEINRVAGTELLLEGLVLFFTAQRTTECTY